MRGVAAVVLALAAAVGLLSGPGVPDGLWADEPVSTEEDGAEAYWRVVLSDLETGAELWSAPARTGDPVVYRWVHSAAKTPVVSRLRVVDPERGFVVEQERYLWYGAGLEFRADQSVRQDGDGFVVDVDRPLSGLVLRVAATVEQRLAVGGETLSLTDAAPEGRRLLLEVRP